MRITITQRHQGQVGTVCRYSQRTTADGHIVGIIDVLDPKTGELIDNYRIETERD
ncbi:hypothetical protein GF373_17545 [bacterium]|nr:hypothetical protein [bacterium]